MKSLRHVSCLVLLITMCFSPLIFAQDEPDEIGSFKYDGMVRNYEVYLPQNFLPNMPLVINLHGYYEDIEWYKEYTYMHEIADTAGYITVYPASKYPSWNTGEIPPDDFNMYDSTLDDVGFISALIDTLHHHYAIDLSRVYGCGFSSGGIMAFRLAVELRHRFAAVASVNGPAIEPFLKMYPLRPIPMLFFHGTDDIFISYEAPHGNLLSAKNTLDYWVESNNCPSQSDTTSLSDLDTTDGATVEKITYNNCLEDSTVIHYKIVEGGHNWPGSPVHWPDDAEGEGNKCMDIDAGVEILRFFNNYENPLVNLAQAKSMQSPRYISQEGDSIIINAQLYNPEYHQVTVYALISGEQHAYIDSVQLYDDGLHEDGEASDNFYGGKKWLSGMNKDIYRIRLRTLDHEVGILTYFRHISRFTTIGPVRLESSFGERGGLGDTLYEIWLSLHNEDNITTIKDVSATLVSMSKDTCYTYEGAGTIDFGDLAPDQTVESNNRFIVLLELDCRDVNILLTFRLDIAMGGHVFWQDTLIYDIQTDLDELDENVPLKFALKQNCPNPFNPTTAISYQLSAVSDVELSIYNLVGQKVATLVSEKQNAGYHHVEWDASGFSSGVYYYRIEVGEFQDVKKMILLR